MKVATLGGIPQALGGAGLELQLSRTSAALTGLGIDVRAVEGAPPFSFDILHAFGATSATFHVLSHWTNNREAPLVVSPILQVGGAPAALLNAALRSRRGPLTSLGMAGRTLRSANLVIALNKTELETIKRSGVKRELIHVIPNGVDPAVPADHARRPRQRPRAVVVGEVTPRKRTLEVIHAVAPVADLTVIGGVDDSQYGRRVRTAFQRTGVDWAGRILDPAQIHAAIREADLLIQFSTSEIESLAALEALALGTPVLASDIPAHRDLARRYPPPAVRLAARSADLTSIVASTTWTRIDVRVPTWEDVAKALLEQYRQLV